MTITRRLKEKGIIHKAEIPQAGCKNEIQLYVKWIVYEKTSN